MQRFLLGMLSSCIACLAVPCVSQATLQSYLDLGASGCQSRSFLFSSFAFSGSTGSGQPVLDPSQVHVFSEPSGPLLPFYIGNILLNPANGSISATINFTVTPAAYFYDSQGAYVAAYFGTASGGRGIYTGTADQSTSVPFPSGVTELLEVCVGSAFSGATCPGTYLSSAGGSSNFGTTIFGLNPARNFAVTGVRYSMFLPNSNGASGMLFGASINNTGPAVPEPSTALLITMGLTAAVLIRTSRLRRG